MQLGKLWGLRRISDDAGYFMMVALDQRHPMLESIARAKRAAIEAVRFADMLDAKRLIVESLGSQATALLVDPNYGIPASIEHMSPRGGLAVTLEDHRFEEGPQGRKSRTIKNWSVAKIRALGADAVKALVWYRPDAGADVVAHQKSFVESIGTECRRHDIAFILELLVYPLRRRGPDGGGYAEAHEKTPELVVESVRDFADARFGVDLFKLESPVAASNLAPREGSPEERTAQAWFDEIGDICRRAERPWVMLSAGVDFQTFSRVLDYAYAAGASGFLAGRAIWRDAIEHCVDTVEATRALLASDAQRLKRLCERTRAHASAWRPDYSGLGVLRAEGDFARSYDPEAIGFRVE